MRAAIGAVTPIGSPRPELPASVHAVEAERTAGHYLVPRLRRQRPEPVADHRRRSRDAGAPPRHLLGAPPPATPARAGRGSSPALPERSRPDADNRWPT